MGVIIKYFSSTYSNLATFLVRILIHTIADSANGAGSGYHMKATMYASAYSCYVHTGTPNYIAISGKTPRFSTYTHSFGFQHTLAELQALPLVAGMYLCESFFLRH